jgi:D-glycero-D-manno-heptose 1,7-bisphosphate phosphatase
MGFLAIVITNQPVIARGEVDFETLDLIHMKMETDLGKYGAYIDDLFYCPHHPDKGFPGKRPEYKIDCDCRKPKPGMILQAAEKFNIDLSGSFMVGDDNRDIQAGINAGCIPVFLTKGELFEGNSVKTFDSLHGFAEWLGVQG